MQQASPASAGERRSGKFAFGPVLFRRWPYSKLIFQALAMSCRRYSRLEHGALRL